MKIKFKLVVVMAIILICISGISVFASKLNNSKDIGVIIDGNKLEFDVAPTIIYGRTLVPLRTIVESLGGNIDWDVTTRTVTAIKGDTRIEVKIDDTRMKVNDEIIEIDVPAIIVKGRTLVPLRFISETFGCKVDWSESTKTVRITTTKVNKIDRVIIKGERFDIPRRVFDTGEFRSIVPENLNITFEEKFTLRDHYYRCSTSELDIGVYEFDIVTYRFDLSKESKKLLEDNDLENYYNEKYVDKIKVTIIGISDVNHEMDIVQGDRSKITIPLTIPQESNYIPNIKDFKIHLIHESYVEFSDFEINSDDEIYCNVESNNLGKHRATISVGTKDGYWGSRIYKPVINVKSNYQDLSTETFVGFKGNTIRVDESFFSIADGKISNIEFSFKDKVFTNIDELHFTETGVGKLKSQITSSDNGDELVEINVVVIDLRIPEFIEAWEGKMYITSFINGDIKLLDFDKFSVEFVNLNENNEFSENFSLKMTSNGEVLREGCYNIMKGYIKTLYNNTNNILVEKEANVLIMPMYYVQ